ncbi:thermopsin [Nanobdella aerobiophila]|uniref:Thermopsin n=1 Tax=Nanobdella aerobiophila TaxID=2586965 RepID=A0A915SCB8_9ARCH|nr:thermopsin [Nanobdella aerobiophila]BBL45253.1 thermopsin [Nanobdella aerobiophila]
MNKKIFFILIILLLSKYINSQSLFNIPIYPAPDSFFNLQPLSSSNSLPGYLSVYDIQYIPSNNYEIATFTINQSSNYYIYFNMTYPVNINIYNSNKQLLYNQSGSNIFSSINLSPGTYNMEVYNYNNQSTTGEAISYVLNSSSFSQGVYLPYGISNLGFAFINNSVYEYNYSTNQFVGYINLQSLQDYINNYCPVSNNIQQYYENNNITGSGISIQLNSMLYIETDSGSNQLYFLQNVLDLNQSSNQYYIADNIWNYTSQGGLLYNQSILGSGFVTNYYNQAENLNESYYYYFGYENQLSFPLNIYLVTNITQNNSYPEVQFGYSFDGQNIIWYDNVTILVPSNYFSMIVYPAHPPYLLDSELVIGGPGDGTCSYINNINGTLSLYFLYQNNGSEYYSPSRFNFNYGLNTLETSTNLQTIYIGDGTIELIPGQSYMNYLSSENIQQDNNYTVMIEYPNNTIYESQYPQNTELNITFPDYINISNYSYYYLNNIIVNNQSYKNPAIIYITNNTIIIPNYTLYYLLSIYSPYNYTINNYSYIGNNSIYFPEGTVLNISFDNIVPVNNYTIYYLSNIILNNQYYNESTLEINLNNYTIIYTDYTLYYLLNISSPFEFQLNNISYYNYSNFLVNGSLINIDFNQLNYINNYERYYCPNNKLSYILYNSTSLDLANFCQLQYLINFYSFFPVNVSLNNNNILINGSYNTYINNGTYIYIEPVKYTYSSFFTYETYYYNGHSYLINGPINININFSRESGYNILNIIIIIIIVAIIIFILY